MTRGQFGHLQELAGCGVFDEGGDQRDGAEKPLVGKAAGDRMHDRLHEEICPFVERGRLL